MSDPVSHALSQFIQKYQAMAQSHPDMLTIEYDPQWPSECYQSQQQGQVLWSPVKRNSATQLTDLAKALDIQIHPDIVSFFTAFWSDNLNAKTTQGACQLLQAWNQDDFERLQQNLVGHVLMKKRLRQPITLFFALTDEEDFILSIDNQSGQVVLEQVGLEPKQVLAPNLADFIVTLSPSSTADC
ncbi:SecY-interacting protein [Paraglaciecola aestuariivivens]